MAEVSVLSIYERLDYIEIPRGSEYQPALTIQSVSSKGQSARILGIKTGRQHELLSRNEQNYFYIAEFSDNVLDIREQFPMNIDKTMLIAEQLGLKHPVDQKAHEPICMTSDFCITVKAGGVTRDIIRTVKPVTELSDRRTLEKLEIERVYWEHEGIDWGIVTDREIDKTLAKNISTIRTDYDLTDVPELHNLGDSTLNTYKQELIRRLVCKEDATRKIIHSFASDYHIPVGACFTLFRHLLSTKVIYLDLRKKLELNQYNKLTINHEIMDKLLRAVYEEAE